MAWPIRFIPTDRSRPSYRTERSGSARSPSCARTSHATRSERRIRDGRASHPIAVTWRYWAPFLVVVDHGEPSQRGSERALREVACAPPPACMLEERECENYRSRRFVLYRREDANNAKDYLCTVMETLLAFLRVQE